LVMRCCRFHVMKIPGVSSRRCRAGAAGGCVGESWAGPLQGLVRPRRYKPPMIPAHHPPRTITIAASRMPAHRRAAQTQWLRWCCWARLPAAAWPPGRTRRPCTGSWSSSRPGGPPPPAGICGWLMQLIGQRYPHHHQRAALRSRRMRRAQPKSSFC
jgi:hypothetical protein